MTQFQRCPNWELFISCWQVRTVTITSLQLARLNLKEQNCLVWDFTGMRNKNTGGGQHDEVSS